MKIKRFKKNLETILPGILLALSLSWFIYRFYWTLGYAVGVMNDEAEHLVIAMMMKAGGHLYGDIFSQHGPFGYLVGQVVYFLTNSLDFRIYRIAVGVLYLLSALAIFFSPVFRCNWQRFCSAAIFLALAAYLAPSWHGHMFIYYNLAGCLFLIAFVQFLLPELLSIKVGKVPLFLGGWCLSLLFFLAYSYVVAIFCGFLLVCCMKKDAGWGLPSSSFWIGIVAGTALNIIWMLFYGDVAGFFAYHFYLNQKIYAQFTSFSIFKVFKNLAILSNLSGDVPPQVALNANLYLWLILLLCGSGWLSFQRIGKSFMNRGQLYLSLVLAGCSLLYLNPTGSMSSPHHIAVFGIVIIGWLAILFVLICEKFTLKRLVIAVLGVSLPLALLGHQAYSSTALIKRYQKIESPGYKRFIKQVQQIIPPEETIGVYTYSPGLYLDAFRLPASGNFAYMPWMAEYSKAPIFGKDIDLCADLRKNRPRIIYYDNRKIWGAYQMSDYAPCVEELLQEQYAPRGSALFLRRDLISEK